jgi:aspartate racemase
MMELRERAPADAWPARAGLLGVLGGMGPLATVDFMHKVLQATPVNRDQDHVPMIVSCIPQVPDRTEAFRGEGESPLDAIVDCGQRLVLAGAGLVAMPCNTAHLWYDEIQAALQVPMLHLVDAALEDAASFAGAQRRLGLLATDATLASGLYVNRRPLEGQPVRWLLPTAGEMSELVMPGIEAVKAGQIGFGSILLARAAQALVRRGAAAVVMGCTEIPLALDADRAGCPVVDATAALARRAVAWSMARRGTALPLVAAP